MGRDLEVLIWGKRYGGFDRGEEIWRFRSGGRGVEVLIRRKRYGGFDGGGGGGGEEVCQGCRNRTQQYYF